ncbi:DUF4493 domain-containing protein [uncultured Bacteroides sp.]|uniref:DUF4493 domain-containing protein n=1 Tax=uncultured Bacteroides sp. TaxID=162156 RepID=UPI0026228783|nr:DUF4493 domain-containing protein [uncultured Bacteroides sp.]
MKRNLLYLCMMIFLLASCQQDELTDMASNHVGYLSIQSVEAQVGAVELVQSRAVDNDFIVEIHKDGALYNSMKYEAGAVPEKIELPAGQYQLVVYNDAYITSANWTNEDQGEPVYYLAKDFTMVEGQVNTVTASVPMINFGVTYTLPTNFDTHFTGIQLKVTVGNRVVILAHNTDESQMGEDVAYFMIPTVAEGEEAPTFQYWITATNADGEEHNTSNTYKQSTGKDLAPGTIYNVTYQVASRSWTCE